jgi:hypothetical protein
VLEQEIPQLQAIAGKVWKKEDELKQLKSELAALDRKIQLELAPPTSEAIEKEKNGNQVKPIMENASQIYNTTSNRISTRDFITDELVIGRPESQPRGNNQPKRDKTIKI